MVFGSGFGAFFSRSLSSPTRSCCCSGPGDRPIRSKIHCAPLLFFRIRLFHLAPCSLDGSFPHPTCLGLIFLPMSFSRCPNSSLFSLSFSSSCLFFSFVLPLFFLFCSFFLFFLLFFLRLLIV